MVTSNLQEILEKEWLDVRKGFYYPQLPKPKLVEENITGDINIENLEIRVSKKFIKDIENSGIKPDESLNAILTHEVTHFMRYPGSVLDLLRLHKAGKEVVSAEKVEELRVNFVEAQTNLYVVNERKHPSLSKVLKTNGVKLKGKDLTKLMYGLYQETSNQDFGVKLNDPEKDLVEKLKKISFTDKNREIPNFKKYIEILKDYQDSQDKGENKKENENPFSGGGRGFTKNQIREGLKQFAKECNNPREYEEVVKQAFPEESNSSSSPGNKPGSGSEDKLSSGNNIGWDSGITLLANNFYSALAEKHSIPIRKKPMENNGSLYPYSHDAFEVGDSITEVDGFSTPGILPGITKKWIRREGEGFGKEDSVPDNFLVIDNSPSMTSLGSPDEKIYQHLVGATAISNAYLSNGGKVAVYSFGSCDHITPLTDNKEVLHREIRRHSSNGGTTFTPQVFKKILESSERPFDVTIISDLGISNLEGFVNSMLKIPNTHRVHILYTQRNGLEESIKSEFKDRENVAVLPLVYERDISEITMGELKKSIK